MRILHVLPQLDRGGASRSVMALSKYSRHQNIIASLLPAEEGAKKLTSVEWIDSADSERLNAAIANTDIVHAHFWNRPELYRCITNGLPPCRLLLTIHIAGDTVPHIITPQLYEFADAIIATSSYTLELPIFRTRSWKQAQVIIGACDLERLNNVSPRNHSGFRVGYVGTVDFAKMHPNFVAMCAKINVPDVTFIVRGRGNAFRTILHQAKQYGIAEKFDACGYAEDIQNLFAELDVFGYPLAQDNYSTSDLILQEAMYAGVPPVVLPYGGYSRLVSHQQTGLIVSESDYPGAIEYLSSHPEERARLSQNARKYAEQHFGAHQLAPKLDAFYESLANIVAKPKSWPSSVDSMADLFCESISNESIRSNARQFVAASSIATQDTILQYRNFLRSDSELRFWAGLVLEQRGQYALAIAEYNAALKLGMTPFELNESMKRASAKIT
jgi:glycosyltransferase involved in cell wall biosynthesis